jgi:hypothetical protein
LLCSCSLFATSSSNCCAHVLPASVNLSMHADTVLNDDATVDAVVV